ncbi:hypothetical protein [Nocardioides panzhihuensis]|uniref:Uncharacterized protein n=1 Tax=Nocardioides panzhihuensis TaxID=860243 RepID=A0A7Z0DNL9_9ACTN|nr:hypothetical protein [Nocardioides panzhihuensis]NYI78688.1 hypothetical protein [Nocardioides panzhihuensis]
MSTDLDDLIRTTLAERAEDAPSAGRVIARAPRPGAARRTTVRRRWARGLATAGLAGALAVTGAVLAPRLLPGETPFEPAMSFAYDGVPRSAEAYRLVLDAPGWVVPRFDGSVTDASHIGAILYEPSGSGPHAPRLDISWGDRSTYQETLAFGGTFNTGTDGITELPIEVLGQEATYWSYVGGKDVGDRDVETGEVALTEDAFQVVLPIRDGHYQAIKGTGMSKAEFEELLTQLRWADHAEFDSALPDRYLTVQERSATIEQLLTGVPLPESYDEGRITSLQPNRYHLALDLARGAVCVWRDEWRAARESGDQERVTHAEDVLQQAGEWPMDQVLDGNDTGDLLDQASTVLDGSERFLCG